MRFCNVLLVAVCVLGCLQETPPDRTGADGPSDHQTPSIDQQQQAATEELPESPSRTNAASDGGPASDGAETEGPLTPNEPTRSGRKSDQPIEWLPRRSSYRPSDMRPVHNDEEVAKTGIRKYESKRLRLYTDIDPLAAKRLPPLIDQVYDAWEAYFGPLPPNREGSAYQITGYVMTDETPFQDSGLVPDDLRKIEHGRHQGARFWINDQKYDYYRRHLVIHEATHCFMTTLPGIQPPIWYMEGMAELFATHKIDSTGQAHFRVMPENKSDFAGWGRITLVQKDVTAHGYRTSERITAGPANDHATNVDYAWWWAFCKFLDTQPRYRDRFRALGRRVMDTEFQTAFRQQFDPVVTAFWTDWPLFAHEIEYGFDFDRSAIEYQTGIALDAPDRSHQVAIAADRSWQPSGVLVEEGVAYAITASGQFTVAQNPKPWVSEANGISFRYYHGRPLGLLLGAIRREPPVRESAGEPMLDMIPIGTQAEFTAPLTGTLYLRINDSDRELADNTGQVQVSIMQKAAVKR